MSELSAGGAVPEWDLADRMRKALRQAHVSVADIAEYLGVTRGTVSTWINGRIAPSTQTLRLWALRCGVDYEWLRGDSPPHPGFSRPDDRVTVRKPGRLAPLMPILGLAA